MEQLQYYDFFWFLLINDTWQNAWLDAIMPFWRDEFFWIPLYVFFATFVWLNYRRQAPYILLFALITVVLTDQIASQLIKPYFGRLRPCRDVVFADAVRLLIPCGSGKSFVSAHATSHFGIATYIWWLFGNEFKWLLPAGLFWAGSVCYGQVYVGVHYPSDVICGAVLGICIGLWTGYWARRWIKLRLKSEKN